VSEFPNAERELGKVIEHSAEEPTSHGSGSEFPETERKLDELRAVAPSEAAKRSSVWAPDVPIQSADEPFYLLGAELGLPYAASRGLLAAGTELGAPSVARFLTGQAGKGFLQRLPSLATSGAWQGALSEGVDKVAGYGHDLSEGAAAGVGAGVNALTHGAVAPFVNRISPEVAKLAQRYIAQGMPLRTYQLPGASSAATIAGQLKNFPLKLLHRIAGLSGDDVKKLSGQLMASMGSKEDQISALGIKDAQADIMERARTARLNNDVQAYNLAANQWQNSKLLENNPNIWNETTGHVDPKGLYRVINSRSAGYGGVGNATAAAGASGNPVDIGTLAEGAKMFSPQGVGVRNLASGVVAGGGLLGFGELEGLPLIETLGHHPGATSGVLGALGGLGALQNTQGFTNLLLDRAARGAGPALAGSNPLIPAYLSTRPSDTEALIRDRAQAKGIDPDVAVRVAKSEGLNDYVGDEGSSFGPFQLHYGGIASGGNAVPGLGETFTRATGLHASDPTTVPQQIDFALDYAKQHGWSPWHGWKGDERAGLPDIPRITVSKSGADNVLSGSQ
jgi:hypothetical protein